MTSSQLLLLTSELTKRADLGYPTPKGLTYQPDGSNEPLVWDGSKGVPEHSGPGIAPDKSMTLSKALGMGGAGALAGAQGVPTMEGVNEVMNQPAYKATHDLTHAGPYEAMTDVLGGMGHDVSGFGRGVMNAFKDPAARKAMMHHGGIGAGLSLGAAGIMKLVDALRGGGQEKVAATAGTLRNVARATEEALLHHGLSNPGATGAAAERAIFGRGGSALHDAASQVWHDNVMAVGAPRGSTERSNLASSLNDFRNSRFGNPTVPPEVTTKLPSELPKAAPTAEPKAAPAGATANNVKDTLGATTGPNAYHSNPYLNTMRGAVDSGLGRLQNALGFEGGAARMSRGAAGLAEGINSAGGGLGQYAHKALDYASNPYNILNPFSAGNQLTGGGAMQFMPGVGGAYNRMSAKGQLIDQPMQQAETRQRDIARAAAQMAQAPLMSRLSYTANPSSIINMLPNRHMQDMANQMLQQSQGYNY